MRSLRLCCLAGVIALCLSTTGCSVFVGFTCMVGIATSFDKTQPALQLPAASLAPYHETVSISGSDWQQAFNYSVVPESVPPGIQVNLLFQDESGHLTPPDYRSKPVREPQGKVWIEVSGTPQKAGKYTIKIKRANYTGMCGSNDQIYPIVLNVVHSE